MEDSMSIPGFIKIDDKSFDRLSTYITQEYGIKLPVTKRAMLESRLNKKVRSLGMDNYEEFLNFIFSQEGQRSELLQVVDLITTNKTDFFREPDHFEFLSSVYLPQWVASNSSAFKIWSAGCSSGEEPYTLIMVLEELKNKYPQFMYSLLASDVSIRVMQEAFRGIYTMDKIATLPIEKKRSYFLRSKQQPDLVRVKPVFRKKIAYKRINLMDDSFGLLKNDYDIIFCRNVLIYFDKATQEKVIRKFIQHLKPGGLLFLGHSESTLGMDLPLKNIRPTVYQVV